MGELTVRCALCGSPSPPKALYCGNCGSRLATAGPQTSAATAVPVGERARVSTFSATVALFLLGLMLSGFAFGFSQIAFPRGYFAYNYNARFLLLALASTGGGLALALGLSKRLHWMGRAPSAVGMLLIAVAEVTMLLRSYWTSPGGPWSLVAPGSLGLGIGLLFPAAFWQNLGGVSPARKAALVVGAITGLALGWWMSHDLGFVITSLLATLLALLVGLPLVLVAPMVGRVGAREGVLAARGRG